MSCTTTVIVAALYILAGILALAGIALTASLFIVEKPGVALTEIRLFVGKKVSDKGHPGRWGYPGPVLIGLSVIFGLGGNLIWLLSS